MDREEDAPSLVTTLPTTGSPWLASYLLERQVVNISTLEPLGRVADVTLDPERRQVVGITVRLGSDTPGLAATVRRAFTRRKNYGALALDHVIALNGDVVTVDAEPIHVVADADTTQPQRMLNLNLNAICELVILTTYGKSLGVLADVLLDHDGTSILGYVVKPTPLAASLLPRLEDIARPEELDTSASGADDGAKPSPLPGGRLRIVPASYRLRFGDSLIMLVSEVEPLQRKVVVISQSVGGAGE